MTCRCGHGRHNHVGYTGGCGLCECVYFREPRSTVSLRVWTDHTSHPREDGR